MILSALEPADNDIILNDDLHELCDIIEDQRHRIFLYHYDREQLQVGPNAVPFKFRMATLFVTQCKR